MLQQCYQGDSRESVRQAGHHGEKLLSLEGVPGEGEEAIPQVTGLGLAVPLTSFSIFTKPSTRVLLPSCRKVRSRGWGEKQEGKRGSPKSPSPPLESTLSWGLLSSGHSELSWARTRVRPGTRRMRTGGHNSGTALTFENQRHKRDHRRFHLGDHFSIAFVVPTGVLAFRRRQIKGQMGPGYPKDIPHSLPPSPPLATSPSR